MRDSLSLTDQGIAQGKGNITQENIQQMLGGVDQNWIFKIIIALIKQDSTQLMALSLEIASYAPSYNRLLADLIQLLHQIAMIQVVDSHFDLSPEHNQLLTKFSQAMSAEDVQLYYQIVLNGRKDLPYASDEQAAFDMVLLRLLAFKPMSNMVIKNQEEDRPAQESAIEFDVTLPDTADNKRAEQKSIPVSSTVVEQRAQTVYEKRDEPSATVLDDTINTVADNDVITEEREQQLADQMAGIESVAEQQMAISSKEDSPIIDDSSYDKPAQEYSTLLPNNQGNEIENHSTASLHNAVNNTADVTTENTQAPRTAVDSVLATRNMLRSRKKELENSGKKSNDVVTRHDTEANNSTNTSPLSKQKENRADVPDMATIPEQPFTVDVIDPSFIKSANQVDKWANMIDSMALGGRLRQLAIHATICETSTDELLVLLLDQSTKHLKTDVAHHQLETELSTLLSRKVAVELKIVEQTDADPYKIQSHINDKRYDYAVELLKDDNIVKALQSQFQAELKEDTITAR
jgi:DNA polymerase-3 subunit gamma/tau